MKTMTIALHVSLLVVWVWAISIFSQTYTPPPNTPLANGEHPRIFFTHSTLLDIKSYLDNYEASNFQNFINIMDGMFSTPASGKFKNYILLDGMNYAFLSYAVHSGLFTNYTFGHTAAEYADKAFEHAQVIDNKIRTQETCQDGDDAFWCDNHQSPNFASDKGGYVNLALGCIYDWCYPYLNLSQKQIIADALIYEWDTRASALTPGRKTMLTNKVVAHAFAGAMGGLAMYGDTELGSPRTDTIQVMLNTIQWVWFDRIFELGEVMFEGMTGWAEGPRYFADSHPSVAIFAAALSSAIDQNIIAQYGWLRYHARWSYFNLLPKRSSQAPDPDLNVYFYDRADDTSLIEWDQLTTQRSVGLVTGMLKSADPDEAGFGRWMLEDSGYALTDDYIQNDEDPRLYWLLYKFLFGYRDVVKKTPLEIGLKTAYRFGLGETILKSALEDTAATKITFWTPTFMLNHHTHFDNGSFTIFKYGNLALDGGNEKGGDAGHFFPRVPIDVSKQPIFHNSLALYIPGNNRMYEYNMDLNVTADYWNHPDNQPGGANHIGTVEVFKSVEGVFDYIDYNYTRSYKGENYVNYIARKLLYIRDPSTPNYHDEEYLIVFDEVDLVDPTIRKRWLLHTANQLDLVDGSWSDQGSGFWTANSGSMLSTVSDHGDWHGKLFIKVLAPDTYELRMRGGSGYWFTDAEGVDLSTRGPFSDWAASWVSRYRLEIQDESGSNPTHFLTVIQIGNMHTLSTMVPVSRIDAGDFMGAFINHNRVAFFNMAGDSSTSITYDLVPSTTVRHIITGLSQGLYYVRVDGNLIPGNFVVDESGVLYFEHTGGTTFSITKSNDVIPPLTPSNLRVLR
ncbi:MAG: hypothetical protein D6830_05020 [Ignavibacteria bacterium]|nr:MAG: hypothetical protein D6830_05020 [Ignavibacteria bacterium]